MYGVLQNVRFSRGRLLYATLPNVCDSQQNKRSDFFFGGGEIIVNSTLKYLGPVVACGSFKPSYRDQGLDYVSESCISRLGYIAECQDCPNYSSMELNLYLHQLS